MAVLFDRLGRSLLGPLPVGGVLDLEEFRVASDHIELTRGSGSSAFERGGLRVEIGLGHGDEEVEGRPAAEVLTDSRFVRWQQLAFLEGEFDLPREVPGHDLWLIHVGQLEIVDGQHQVRSDVQELARFERGDDRLCHVLGAPLQAWSVSRVGPQSIRGEVLHLLRLHEFQLMLGEGVTQ
ncbi:MAG: hypothetical protein ABW123_25875 [Cystobacter sp.]